jgi:hypothetical protein
LTVPFASPDSYSVDNPNIHPVHRHDEPLSREVVMYSETVLIKLSPIEIQQALAIELDRDSSLALQFIKEKIVDKYFQAPCKLAAVTLKGTTP